MCDFNLKFDSFRKEEYYKFRDINIHQSVESSDTIYHYLKLEYLLQILDKQKIRFSNRKSFSDQSEKGKKSDIKNSIRLSPHFSDEKDKKDYKEYEKQRDANIADSYKTCISCWTYDIHQLTNSNQIVTEDFFMWKAYAANGVGARIETTIEDLLSSFQELPCDILVSKVSYKKETPTYSVDEAVFTKPIFYDKEQELRICALSPKESLFLRIDTSKLIHSVLLSPFISKEYAKFIVKSIEDKYPILKGKIKKSNILEYK